jgi:RNA polymerase sigma-70 factor, ECF subfamily
MWHACWQRTVEDRPAAELGLTVNAGYVARSRVLRRLREELRDVLDG